MFVSDHPLFKFVVDPTNSFAGVPVNRLVDACGFIPYWIDVTDERSFQQQIDDNYGFGLFEIHGSKIAEDGTYIYPNDPDLKPYLKWERPGETAYMYAHALMSFIKDGKTFVTRVD